LPALGFALARPGRTAINGLRFGPSDLEVRGKILYPQSASPAKQDAPQGAKPRSLSPFGALL